MSYVDVQKYEAHNIGDDAWAITGVAGFIGSALLEHLLASGARVTGLDNFATGHQSNLEDVRRAVTAEQWASFTFIEGDIRDPRACKQVVAGADHVLHHAALGSVPHSVDDPRLCNDVNVGGFVNVLLAARDVGANVVYASSSAIYGDDSRLPKIEHMVGEPLSPYAASKLANEFFAESFSRCYGMRMVGLRYFNVFGRRQDPNGAYAAVVPRWIATMIDGCSITINGDGETTRDFCHVTNVVHANMLAARASLDKPHEVFNIALGERTSLNQLHSQIRVALAREGVANEVAPVHDGFRPGDVRHSQADVARAKRMMGFVPAVSVQDGLHDAVRWYLAKGGKPR